MQITNILQVLSFLAILNHSLAFAFDPFSLLRKMSSTTSSAPSIPSFYHIVEKDANGNDVSFESFRGKTLYGVNVASRCGYTASGYAQLAKIAAMKDRGVEVLLFPCNQFGGQEPGTDTEIADFCVARGVPNAHIFTKADVNGDNTRPTYRYLKEKGVFGHVSWNFSGKFLVDKNGNVFPVKNEKNLEAELEALLLSK